MDAMTARAYQLNHLDIDRIRHLHSLEKALGRCYSPAEIRERANKENMKGLPQHGDIPDYKASKVAAVVMAHYNRLRKDIFERDEAPVPWKVELSIIHGVDIAVKSDVVDFAGFDRRKTGDKLLERSKNGKKQAEAESAPY